MNELVAAPLSQVTPESIRWLWKPYIARGKIVLLDGDPGVGKSFLTIDLAARLSHGNPLPDGTPSGKAHTIMLLGAEDDAADTIRPRAAAAGADLGRVITVVSRSDITFPNDLPALAALMDQHRPDLVVIDPITAFLAQQIAANSDQSVRRVFAQLARMAERADCAILLVRHLRKKGGTKALHLGLGSIGMIASVRTGLLAARHPADATRCVLAMTKSNLTGSAPSMSYRILGRAGDEDSPATVEWLGPAELTANALVVFPEAPLRLRDRASCWLQTELASGPRNASELLVAAATAGIPERTLRRAKADLGIASQQSRHGNEPEWYWYDPSAPWPKNAPIKKPFTLEPLEDL